MRHTFTLSLSTCYNTLSFALPLIIRSLSLTHSLSHSFSLSQPPVLSLSLTHTQSHLLSLSLVLPLTHSPSHSFISHSLILSLTHLLPLPLSLLLTLPVALVVSPSLTRCLFITRDLSHSLFISTLLLLLPEAQAVHGVPTHLCWETVYASFMPLSNIVITVKYAL